METRETDQWLVSAGKKTMKAVKGIVSAGNLTMNALQWIISIGTTMNEANEATQLTDDLSRLRGTLPRASILIHRGEWGRFKDKRLEKLLSRLRNTTYDAEDLLRELEDQMLRQNIEDAERSKSGQLLSSSLNLAKILFNRTKIRVKETQVKLDEDVAQIERALNDLLLNVEPVQLMPETSSVIRAPQVFGRDSERDAMIEMLGVTIGREGQLDQVIQLLGVPPTRHSTSAGSKGKRAAASKGVASTSRAKRLKENISKAGHAKTNHEDNVSAVAIVGIGGVGKTTLAQLIYNDPSVQAHFTVRIWVCVSDFFDKRRITKEITESISKEEVDPSRSMDFLHVELVEQLKRHKFLLVLDDIWPNAIDDWDAFYTPLRHGLEGSMILVTTRYPKVADVVTTSNCKSVQLEGLPTDVFWEFFKKCSFGKNDPESYPHLQDIGKSISSRLCGSPLAAKTLGRLLNMKMTEEHWRTVQNSELWKLPRQENDIFLRQKKEHDILPALELSYLYLPPELKRCFAFCSMFPKDHSFERNEIVDIWVAQGFVEQGGSMRLEDEGIRYLDDLRSRFLFQNDPKFPNEPRYVMHDLIHDMAQSVSADECFVIQDISYLQNQMTMMQTFRHMSIQVRDEYLSGMGEFQHLNKLHSLRFGTKLGIEVSWFNQLSNILFLSLKGCRLEKLPESICELNSLRYLDISHSLINYIPDKFWSLYSLQVLDARRSCLKKIHPDATKLINLRCLALPVEASRALSTVSGLGNLSCLRNLREFKVGTKNGRGIGELKSMNQLSGNLHISSLCCIRSKEVAAEARLADKQYLKELVLQWRPAFVKDLMCRENGVIDGLRPHSRIECLKIIGFCGDSFPSWFKPEDLPSLKSLEISQCFFLKSLSIVPRFADGIQAGLTGDEVAMHASSSISGSNGIESSAFTRLTAFHLRNCNKLTNLDQFLSPANLPSIKSICLEFCQYLESVPVHSLVEFTCLQDLKICVCPRLLCPQKMVLPTSLRRLSIAGSNYELEKSFPSCLENLTSLTLLQLRGCNNVKSIPLNSIARTNMLKCLSLSLCRDLKSIGGSHGLSSIRLVQIFDCPMLTDVEQPFEKEAQTKEDKELLQFLVQQISYIVH